MRTKSILLMVIAVCLFCPLAMAQITIGPGGTYATLEDFRKANLLRNGNQTVVFNGNDSSLTSPIQGALSNVNLTFQGQGIISPASSNSLVNDSYVSVIFNSDSLEIRDFNGGSSRAFTVRYANISNGTNTFADNSSNSYGGAIYTTSNVNIYGGTNTFSGNSAGSYGGAISAGNVYIYDGTNTFSGNSAPTSNGGAIRSSNLTISGGTNLFENNTGNTGGGAIYTTSGVNISSGSNTFSGNSANSNNGSGGALYVAASTTISGGTNTFTGNSAGGTGGAIHAGGNLTLRASDGDFSFRGNRDRVGTTSQKANAVYTVGSIITLTAEEGQNIYFYDPITTSTGTGRSININNLATDTGRVVFDGSDYTRAVDRFSEVYGNTIVGYGELALKGDVTYGATSNSGSFTLNNNAMLTADGTTNRIQANRITMNGTVDIANGGTLELAATAETSINGTLSFGLGFDPFESVGTFGVVSAFGNLTFGTKAMLSVYGDDSLLGLTESWSNTYNLFDMFSATGNITGLANLMFDASWFDAYDGFSYTLDNGILSLSYSAAEVPEPATLLMLGLGLAGLPVVRRFRRE